MKLPKVKVPAKRSATIYSYVKPVNKLWVMKQGKKMGLKLSPALDVMLDHLRKSNPVK